MHRAFKGGGRDVGINLWIGQWRFNALEIVSFGQERQRVLPQYQVCALKWAFALVGRPDLPVDVIVAQSFDRRRNFNRCCLPKQMPVS